MIIPNSVRCNVCPSQVSQNEKSTGWYSVSLRSGEIKIRAFEESYAEDPALCGDRCLHTFLSQNTGGLHDRHA